MVTFPEASEYVPPAPPGGIEAKSGTGVAFLLAFT